MRTATPFCDLFGNHRLASRPPALIRSRCRGSSGRVHDDGIGRGELHTFAADTVVREVLVDARDTVEIADAFALDAQRHDDIGVLEALIRSSTIVASGNASASGASGGGRYQPQFADAERIRPCAAERATRE